jgi:hypothetical protein
MKTKHFALGIVFVVFTFIVLAVAKLLNIIDNI